jgi:hypothetical protein
MYIGTIGGEDGDDFGSDTSTSWKAWLYAGVPFVVTLTMGILDATYGSAATSVTWFSLWLLLLQRARSHLLGILTQSAILAALASELVASIHVSVQYTAMAMLAVHTVVFMHDVMSPIPIVYHLLFYHDSCGSQSVRSQKATDDIVSSMQKTFSHAQVRRWTTQSKAFCDELATYVQDHVAMDDCVLFVADTHEWSMEERRRVLDSVAELSARAQAVTCVFDSIPEAHWCLSFSGGEIPQSLTLFCTAQPAESTDLRRALAYVLQHEGVGVTNLGLSQRLSHALAIARQTRLFYFLSCHPDRLFLSYLDQELALTQTPQDAPPKVSVAY